MFNERSKIYWKKPIILKWIKKESMGDCLKVIDKKVSYLLKKNAIKKLEQWFLSDDQNFNSITAERYIIDYLKSKNKNIEDNIKKEGVDAFMNLNKKINIEVTTLNSFLAEWILIERLPLFLDEKNKKFLSNGIELFYSLARLVKEMKKNNIYSYIENIGNFLLSKDNDKLKKLEIRVKYNRALAGCISWSYLDENNNNFLKCLSDGLIRKINKKSGQLGKHKALIFVGVNHVAASNWWNPGIFQEIGKKGISYKEQIRGLQDYLSSYLSENILGVCYFLYSLNQEKPFYPLRIFWRNGKERVNINL